MSRGDGFIFFVKRRPSNQRGGVFKNLSRGGQDPEDNFSDKEPRGFRPPRSHKLSCRTER